MKTNQIATLFFLLLFCLSGCEKPAKSENFIKSAESEKFMKNEWKVESVVNENKRFIITTENTFFREEAYILKFVNDSDFVLNTSVNYAGGSFQITSEGQIIINYGEWTEVGNAIEHQKKFDEQLLFVFNGVLTYTHTKDKLTFRGEENKEIVFVKVNKNNDKATFIK